MPKLALDIVNRVEALPSTKVLDALDAGGFKIRTVGKDQWKVQCPAHDDRNPSLSVGVADDGRLLLHCHAGCDTEAVVDALGLTMADLFAEDYDYGTRVVRRTYDREGKKRFVQFRVVGDPVLYHRDEVTQAVANGRVVYLVEGEKDAETLRSFAHAAATTAPQGAGSFAKVDVEPLRGAVVEAILDDDEAGRKWAGQVAARLQDVADQVTFYLPAEGYKDVSDMFAAGLRLDGLRQVQIVADEDIDDEPVVVSPSASDGTDGSEAPAGPKKASEAAILEGVVPDFWERRPILRYVRQAALSRDVTPWPVLGNVLVMVLTSVGPEVVLPPTIGSIASLNLYVCTVAKPGRGKGASRGVARDLLRFRDPVISKGIGSGEGMAKAFCHYEKPKKGDPDEGKGPRPVWTADRLLFDSSEVDVFTALAARQGSSLSANVRRGWSGEGLGFANAGVDTMSDVPEHTYRLCMSLQAQPRRLGSLLAEADGGTPQRFVWFPYVDPTITDEDYDNAVWPGEWLVDHDWYLPPGCSLGEPRDRQVMSIPAEVAREIKRHHRRSNQGLPVDEMAGHRYLVQLKVAAAFAILDNRLTINLLDWDLASEVLGVSDRTLAWVGDEVQKLKITTAYNEGVIRATQTAAARANSEDAADFALRSSVLGKVEKFRDAEGWVSYGTLSKNASKRLREALPELLPRMVAAGELRHSGATQGGNRYALA